MVKYQVAANESAEQRTGTITIAGKTHTVVQAGAEVLAKPVIGKQETEAVGIPGESLVLVVEVSGEGVSYQWQKDGADVPGATSASLELSSISDGDAGSYVLKASNAGGSVESEPIVVSVARFVIVVNGKAAGSKVKVVGNALVEIRNGKPEGWLTYYTLDGSEPDYLSDLYDGPFDSGVGATVRVVAYAPGYTDLVQGPTVEVLVLKSQTLSVQPPQGLVYGAAPIALVGSSD